MPTPSGWKLFTGSILTSDDVNDYLMSQSVMVFANSAERTSELGAPVEGMASYLKDTDELEVYNGSSWLRVVVTNDDEAISVTSFSATVQPSMRASRGSSGAVGAGNKIIFTSVKHDLASNYNSGTGRFTCPKAGVYQFSLAGISDVSTQLILSFYKNGAELFQVRNDDNATTYGLASGTINVSCVATDYLEAYVTRGAVYGSTDPYSVTMSIHCLN